MIPKMRDAVIAEVRASPRATRLKLILFLVQILEVVRASVHALATDHDADICHVLLFSCNRSCSVILSLRIFLRMKDMHCPKASYR